MVAFCIVVAFIIAGLMAGGHYVKTGRGLDRRVQRAVARTVRVRPQRSDDPPIHYV